MQFLDNLTGPQFLIFYAIVFVVLLILTDFRGSKAVWGFLISEGIINAVAIIRMADSLAEGHHNVLFLILFMVAANLVFILRLIIRLGQAVKGVSGRAGRRSGGRHSSGGVGEAATAGFFFGSWGSDSSGSSCSSGSSGSSCSSGCGGCGGGGGGD